MDEEIMNLPDYLTELMYERRIDSQRELAEKAGVSQATINNILQGRMVKADTLRTIADNLGLPHEDILVAAGYLPPRGGQEEMDALARMIMAMLVKLPRHDKRDILALAQAKLARIAEAEEEEYSPHAWG